MSDLLHYLPDFMQEYREIRQIAKAENPEMEFIQKYASAIPKESCISTTTEDYGLKRYEMLLGITPEDGDTIVQRRMRILQTWSKKGITIRWLEQTFQEQFGDKVTIAMPEPYTLALTVHNITAKKLKILEQLMQDQIPANIAYTISGDTHKSSEGVLYYAGAVVNTIQYTIGEN